MTQELFQWSYRDLNENANNLIKGPEKGREGERMGRRNRQAKKVGRNIRSERRKVKEVGGQKRKRGEAWSDGEERGRGREKSVKK